MTTFTNPKFKLGQLVHIKPDLDFKEYDHIPFRRTDAEYVKFHPNLYITKVDLESRDDYKAPCYELDTTFWVAEEILTSADWAQKGD